VERAKRKREIFNAETQRRRGEKNLFERRVGREGGISEEEKALERKRPNGRKGLD
jgi:hypothetical protein